MDSEHPTEPDYIQPRADDEMQVDTAFALESHNTLGEVEMLSPAHSRSNTLEIAERESSATPLDTPVSQMPSLDLTSLSQPSPQRTSTRRTRVEDDHDDERDRRHPSQRLGSPSHPLNLVNTPIPSSSRSTSSIPTETGSNPSGLPSSNSRPFRFFQHMTPHHHPGSDGFALPNPRNAPQPQTDVDAGAPPVPQSTTNPIPPSDATAVPAPQQTPQPGNNHRHQYLGGFAITIDVNGNATTMPLPGMPNPNTAANAPMTEPRDEQTPAQNRAFQQPPPTQPPPPPPGAGTFADLLTRIGLLAALSFQNPALFEREVDDPERAKKLVEGLEDVPVGLVRRLERVGKNGEEGGLGDGGCAVCWERLLFDPDEAAQEEAKTAAEKEPKDKEAGACNSDVPPPETTPDSSNDDMPAASSPLTSLPSSTSSSTLTSEAGEKKEKNYQRVVSLPCAHVFHAACLIPWFSKPKQTTCPICRFNIDPDNLTYNPGAQRRAAAAAAGQPPTRESARGEAGEALGQGGQTEAGTDAGDGPTEVGIDIPLMFGGSLPVGIPIRGAERNNPQPRGAASTQTETAPANTDNTATDADSDLDDAESDGGDNAAAIGDRDPHDIVTIGFDMYIGRGPPPFPFRGPGIIQIPLPGPPPTTNNPVNAPPAAANDAPQLPLPTSSSSNATPTVNPNPPTGSTPGANASGTGTGQQGNEAQENTNGGRPPGAGTTFAIPIPMTQGFGRALGDMFLRFLGGGGPNAPSGPTPTAAAAPSAGTTGTGAGQNQSQGQVVFGPERPPVPMHAMPPPGRPSMPIPANVGLGFGFGFGGGRGQGVTPIILPFGPHGGGGPGRGAGAAPGAGAGANGGVRGQGQEQASQGQGGARGGQPEIVFESAPFFDIVSGLFGPPPGPVRPRGPATAEEGGAGQQLPQSPPAQTQEQFHQPGGFGFTWMPGSPPPRPSSSSQPQQPPKKWAPPPAPGLTLRQRVEKKEKEAGLRCCDISCGIGPSDDDPWVDVPAGGMRQLTIRGEAAATDEKIAVGGDEIGKAVCSHTFHSSCLVSTERVALALRDAEVLFVGPEGRKEVEVSCPVCRGAGRVSKEEWDAGVQALG